AGRTDDAARLAHTLKGLAATLGASTLAGVAADAEQALRGPTDASDAASRAGDASAALQAALSRAVPALKRLCEGAEAFTPTPIPSDAALPAAPEALGEALRNLAALLRDADMEALAVLEQLRGRGAARAAQFEPLDDAVTRLDFDAALCVCQAWLKEIGA
ncbi:MAG: Hpt domain-containing protein, partial [Rubrivivax sp.]